jgi:prepilin-type N-terminal cleavage/methylation domain-containing protein
MKRTVSSEQGFTLIELLVVIAIIGVLSGLSFSNMQAYKRTTAYSVATQTVKDARTALEAGLVKEALTLPAVGPVSQSAAGTPTDASMVQVFPGFLLSQNVKVTVSFDPSCIDPSCTSAFIEARHCQGEQYLNWTRLGDGVELLVQNIAGVGC